MKDIKKLISLMLFTIPFLFINGLVFASVSQLAGKNKIQQKVSQLTIAATNGNVDAQAMLGMLYTGQLGVKPDYKKSLFWSSKAVKKNNPLAQFAMGQIYMKGLGVPQDYKKAMHWLRLSAMQGNSDAQNSIAFMYDYSLGVDGNPMRAIHWYTLSANQGNLYAQNNLGLLYFNGSLGLKPNFTKAKYWLSKAADKGYQPAVSNLKLLEYLQEHHISLKTFVTTIAKKKIEALQRKANRGDAKAQFLLGMTYMQGIQSIGPRLEDVIHPNKKLAKMWLQKAAKNGNLDAKKLLATDKLNAATPISLE